MYAFQDPRNFKSSYPQSLGNTEYSLIPLGGGGDQQDWNMKSPLIPNCFLGLEFLI